MTTTPNTAKTITCPMHLGGCGELVAVTNYDDFNSPTVEVAACRNLLDQGWTGPQLVEWRSRADYL
jgi:hypothetical protein